MHSNFNQSSRRRPITAICHANAHQATHRLSNPILSLNFSMIGSVPPLKRPPAPKRPPRAPDTDCAMMNANIARDMVRFHCLDLQGERQRMRFGDVEQRTRSTWNCSVDFLPSSPAFSDIARLNGPVVECTLQFCDGSMRRRLMEVMDGGGARRRVWAAVVGSAFSRENLCLHRLTTAVGRLPSPRPETPPL
jgi:hypothetical protein